MTELSITQSSRRRHAASRGQLREFMDAEVKAIRGASDAAVKGTTDDIKLETRTKVVNAFAGSRGARRVGNTIRSKFYQNDGAGDRVGIIYSKFGRKGPSGEFVDYLAPYVTGATMRPRSSKWLYISLEKGAQGRRRRRFSTALAKNIEFVPSKDGRKIWLIRRTKTRSTLLAVLVKRTTVRKRLDFSHSAAADRLPENLLHELEARNP